MSRRRTTDIHAFKNKKSRLWLSYVLKLQGSARALVLLMLILLVSHLSTKAHKIQAEYYQSVINVAEGKALYDYGRLLNVGYAHASTVMGKLEGKASPQVPVLFGDKIKLSVDVE